ncbi:NrfD/PsrC family molybdoenzyme membrane anchor subunit [Chloroflexota bacterium]
MTFERQTVWGRLIILDMFFAGVGAGVFPVSFLLYVIGVGRPAAIVSGLLSLPFVLLGLVFLLAEVRAPFRARRVFSGFSTSWMSRGALVQVVFIIFVLGYAILALWLPGYGSIILVVGAIALVLAVIITIYHGMVLSQVKAIPFWSSSALPLFFFVDALCGGLGLTLLVHAAYVESYIEISRVFQLLGVLGVVLIAGELVGIWSVIRQGLDATYSGSGKRVKVPLVIATAFLALCLALLAWGLLVEDKGLLTIILVICGALLLANSLVTRYSVIGAGYHYPLQVRLPT